MTLSHHAARAHASTGSISAALGVIVAPMGTAQAAPTALAPATVEPDWIELSTWCSNVVKGIGYTHVDPRPRVSFLAPEIAVRDVGSGQVT